MIVSNVENKSLQRHFLTRDIPFHGNHNNVSCGQCVYKMMLDYFYPNQDWPFENMNELCDATPGKYTWFFRPAVELQKLGLEGLIYTKFDTEQFLHNPEKYLLETCGVEGQKDNIENSDMPKTLTAATEYLACSIEGKITEINQEYTPEILRHLLEQGYLICVWVNSKKLNNLEGTTGHFILVHDFDHKGFVAHDPGGNFPDGTAKNQFENRYILDNDLMGAATHGNGRLDDIYAYKKPS